MKQLTSYNKNGYHFQLVKRHGLNAIFLGSKPGSRDANYEVIRLRECPAGSRIVRDKETGTESQVDWEAHEAAPSDNEWGTRGWTCSGIIDAEAKLESLTQQANQKYVS